VNTRKLSIIDSECKIYLSIYLAIDVVSFAKCRYLFRYLISDVGKSSGENR